MLTRPLLIAKITHNGNVQEQPIFGDMTIGVPEWAEMAIWENEQVCLWVHANVPGHHLPEWQEWMLDDEHGKTHHIRTTMYANGMKVETYAV